MNPLLIPLKSKDKIKFLRSWIYDTGFCEGAYIHRRLRFDSLIFNKREAMGAVYRRTLPSHFCFICKFCIQITLFKCAFPSI